ncbi:TPA: hypothetical protein ACGO00_001483 [Streptococcus suis]|uniref:Uncharacterized protein n=1 Tax=Streptococcus suis TaxID=1307 RepID=A0A116QUK6_STRSU|nr:hypothetical protein [Streptococcus suis]CYU62445.1 Uncharacterised protein [Streptococcus suis]CYX32442.1 Uncharacterised protein [Streptococcus suis]
MNKKKIMLIIYSVGTCIFSLLTLNTGTVFAKVTESQSASNLISNVVISSEKKSPYVIEFETQSHEDITNMNERSSKTRIEYSSSTVTLDFSEAEFFDENGNIVNKDTIMNTIKPIETLTRSASTSGGSWSSGSGYKVCKGMKVTGNSGLIGLQVSYFVDFQNIQAGYDRIDRVYGALVDGLGTWSFLANGVFRVSEGPDSSAYGGIKGQWTFSSLLGLPQGTSTKYLYFRVGNDSFWLDTNL